MRINVAVPEAHVNKPILDAALEAVTRLDESLIRQGVVPLFDAAKHKVRWKPEPKGDEHFDHAALVLKRGWGDCDDMAPWKAASLRVTGQDPEAEAVVRKSGHRKWHAVVDRSDGSQDDPSRETGMGSVRNPRPGVFGVNGAVLPLLSGVSSVMGEEYFHRPKIAMRPIRNESGSHICGWEARVDMPWVSGVVGADDLAMTTSARHNCSSEALINALKGAIHLAEESGEVSGEAIDRAEAIIDACDGAHWDDLAEVYGAEVADETMAVVGGFFKKLSRGIKKVSKGALKIASSKFGRGLISMVPGVGPAAAAALDMAGPALQKMIDKGGKRPGSKLATQMQAMGATKLVKRAALPAGPVRRVKASRVRRKKSSSRVVIPKKRRIVAPGRAKGSGRIVTLSFPFPE